MTLQDIKERYVPRDKHFYRDHYHRFIYALMIIIVLMMIVVTVVLTQIFNRPLPVFHATLPDGKRSMLTSFERPNVLPDTIIKWASKAAIAAYTFNFVNYNDQIKIARPYFTDAGWRDYIASVNDLVNTVVQNSLFVNGVVAGTPVIANHGPLLGRKWVWRVQIPFLVTYQSANTTRVRNFYVTLTIVSIPTNVNPQGIGIDQFVMSNR